MRERLNPKISIPSLLPFISSPPLPPSLLHQCVAGIHEIKTRKRLALVDIVRELTMFVFKIKMPPNVRVQLINGLADIEDEKQQLLLGIRLANRQPANISSSVLSSDSMHIGILAAAAHAAANNSPFTVFYNPRASPSEFVIPLAKYYKAVFLFSFSEFVRWKNSQWCNLQSITRFTAEGIGSVCGRLSIGTAEKIPESEIIGTTDARTHLLELFYTLYVPTLIQWQCCHLLLMW
ncbi:hypothetical protein Ahy_A06g028769 isoform B [Arachis hypogaea]|uniref:Uncharacterized protein n=1 Tax=Arachis hypogaea TaxID=3818 RepID=A0A445CRS6_ARAHY|nr:hypothetical protein Ahy_A06g028769 isoform B [Arachis hypogaea]